MTIGNSSRDPKPTDPGGLVFHKIARDAICVVTNTANPLPNLSQSGVQAIFHGSVRHWNEVPGAGRGSNTIDLYVRTAASGTQDAFQKLFMDPVSVNNSIAKQLASNGLIQQKVKSDKDGVGYVSLYFAKGTHPVPYKGVALHAAATPSPASTVACATSGWSPRATARGRERVDPLGPDHAARRSRSSATNWVPLH